MPAPIRAAMGEAVKAAVGRNAQWRGEDCINLLAPEAPTSPGVRALLAAEIGTRAAEGHIGRVNRWFAGTRHIDEVEALCVELLKRHFRCNYADHRMCASMIGNAVVYTALTAPGDVVMTAAQPVGGHSSNRHRRPGRRHGPHHRRHSDGPGRAGGRPRPVPPGGAAGPAEAGRARPVDDAVPAAGRGDARGDRATGAGASSSTRRTSSA